MSIGYQEQHYLLLLSTIGDEVCLRTCLQRPTTNNCLKTSGHIEFLTLYHGQPIGGTHRSGFLHLVLYLEIVIFSLVKI